MGGVQIVKMRLKARVQAARARTRTWAGFGIE